MLTLTNVIGLLIVFSIFSYFFFNRKNIKQPKFIKKIKYKFMGLNRAKRRVIAKKR